MTPARVISTIFERPMNLSSIAAYIGTVPAPLVVIAVVAVAGVMIAVVIGIIGDAAAADAMRRKQAEEEQRRKLGIVRLCVDAGRRVELFTPSVLPAGDRYRVVIAGRYTFRHWGTWREADAFYDHNDLPYGGLYIDGLPVQPTELDRAARIYAYSYVGIGRRLSVFLRPCKGINNDTACGRLTLDVIPEKLALPLPQTSLSFAHQQQIEGQRQAQAKADREEQARLQAEREGRRQQAKQHRAALEAQRRAQQEKKREEDERACCEEQEQRAHLEEVATGLRIRAELEQNWLNPGYRRNLAEHHTNEVLNKKHEFGQIYYQIRSNSELMAVLTADAPLVFDWIKGWHDTILRAERVKALPPAPRTEPAPAPALPPPRPERRRLTEDEVRAKKNYLIKRDGRDKIASRIAKEDLLQEYAELLAQKYPDMDDDERQQRVNEFSQELMEDNDNDSTKIQ